MNEFIKLSERFPEENDLVYFMMETETFTEVFIFFLTVRILTAILTHISLQSGV